MDENWFLERFNEMYKNIEEILKRVQDLEEQLYDQEGPTVEDEKRNVSPKSGYKTVIGRQMQSLRNIADKMTGRDKEIKL